MCASIDRQLQTKNPRDNVGQVVAQAMHGRFKISKRILAYDVF